MTRFELQIDEKPKVRRVLETVREYAIRGITYQGQRIKGQGRKPLVTAPQEYQILIGSMEQGIGLVTAMYRSEEDLPEVGLSTEKKARQ
jgi:hypothetical protein